MNSFWLGVSLKLMLVCGSIDFLVVSVLEV